jgi:hypothetical protein
VTTPPPRVVGWLLERARVDSGLVGDLCERYATTHSRAWLWRQTVVAVAMATGARVKKHPRRIVAVIGTAAIGVAALWAFNLTRSPDLPFTPHPPVIEQSFPVLPPPPPPPPRGSRRRF